MDAQLIVQQGTLAGSGPEISGPEVRVPIPPTGGLLVGRRSTSNLRFDDQHLMVSGHHATIYELKGRYLVRDEQSRNGTFVNGKRVLLQELSTGDTLQFGPGGPVVRFERTSESLPPSLARVPDTDPGNDSSEQEEPAWYYLDAIGEQHGPMSRRDMIDEFHRKRLNLEVLVWAPHLPNWLPVAEVLPVSSKGPPTPSTPVQAIVRDSGTSEQRPSGRQPGWGLSGIDATVDRTPSLHANPASLDDGFWGKLNRLTRAVASAVLPHRRRLAPTTGAPSADAEEDRLCGVRGWLLVYVLLITVIGPVGWTATMYVFFNTVWPTLAQHHGLRVFYGLELVRSLVLVVVGCYVGVGLWRVRTGAVRLAKSLLWARIGSAIVMLVAYSVLTGNAGIVSDEYIKGLVNGDIVGASAWLAYLRMSKRVAATYDG